MNPRSLRATNYRTFERLELDLPSGCCAVVGDNGVGKSSIINLLDLIPFGPESRTWQPYLRQGSADTEMELELVFEHDGELYRVRRHYSGRGRGKATLDVERNALRDEEDERGQRPDSWLPENRETAEQTQQHLERLLGLDRETFRASSFLAQGQGAVFTEAAPRDRKRLLAATLGLGVWDAYLELARRDKRAAQDELQRIAGRLEGVDEEALERARVRHQAELHVAEEMEKNAAAALLVAEDAHVTATQRLDAAREAVGARQAAEARLDVARAAYDAHAHKRAEAEDARRSIVEFEPRLEALATADQIEALEQREQDLAGRIAEHDVRIAEHSAAVGAARAAADRRNDLVARAAELHAAAAAAREAADEALATVGQAVCPTCQQTMGVQAAEAFAKTRRGEAEEYARRAGELDRRAAEVEVPDVPANHPQLDTAVIGELLDTRSSLRTAREELLGRERLSERRARLQATVDVVDSDEYREELGRLHAALALATTAVEDFEPLDLEPLQADVAAARARADEERDRLQTARTAIPLARREVERINETLDFSIAARGRRDELHTELDALTVLERAYGRDGVPAMIVSQAAIPSIETEATRILGDLGTSYRVELRTERELKGGGVGDTLDVIVVTEQGERPFETFSGGEKTRVNLALRIALAELLAARRGANSRVLVIDEPEHLDAAGTAALAAVLRGLTGRFSRIFLVSHVPDLRDAFDQAIEVVRDGDVSKVAA